MRNEADTTAPSIRIPWPAFSTRPGHNPAEKGAFYNTKFENRYQDKDGAWKSSKQYSLYDLFALQQAVSEAISETLRLQR